MTCHRQVREIYQRHIRGGSRRVAPLVAVHLLMLSTISQAQTIVNPRVARFAASPEQDAIRADGQPAISRYLLEISRSGETQPALVLDLGKPGPEPDGYIRVNLRDVLAIPPFVGTPLTARIAAVGPGGVSRSNATNAFVFNSCTYGVTPSQQRVASGGSSSIQIAAAAGCEWSASTDAAWVLFGTSAAGAGNATLAFTLAPNTEITDRTAVLNVADQVVTVTESAASAPPPPPPPPPTGNSAPQVRITSPSEGGAFQLDQPIEVRATATDADGVVTRVTFYADGVLIGSSTAAPFASVWSSARNGQHALTAVAEDDDGAQTTSAAVSMTVKRKLRR